MFLSSGLWDRFRETDINAEMISRSATEVVNLTRKQTNQVIYLPNNYIPQQYSTAMLAKAKASKQNILGSGPINFLRI